MGKDLVGALTIETPQRYGTKQQYHLTAQSVQETRTLERDVPSADDQHLPRPRIQREQVVGTDAVLARADEVFREVRPTAHCDDDMLSANRALSALGINEAYVVATIKPAELIEVFDARMLKL